MGPRRFRRGNATGSSPVKMAFWLQWGRDVSVAEIHYADLFASRCATLQWGRDVSVAEINVLVTGSPICLVLQWGRDVSVAEIGRGRVAA